MKGRKRSWSDDDLRLAVPTHQTIAGVLRSLSLTTHAGNYKMLHRHVKRLGLDTSHFTGRGHGFTGKVLTIPLEKILVKGSTYSNTTSLKNKLVREGLIKQQCSKCQLGTEWQGEPIVLQLDHVNGDSTDHRIENIRLLCPNCHSQTHSFSRGLHRKQPPKCVVCGASAHKQGFRCKSCSHLGKSKIQWPPAEDLATKVEHGSYAEVARQLGVSGSAVKKHLAKELGWAPRKHHG